MRINKYLANQGVCSRRSADRLIEEGRVMLNGKRAVLGDDVGEEDVVTVNDVPVAPVAQRVYYAYHKPRGVEVTHAEGAGTNLPISFGIDQHLFAVGRLDKDSSGLLLVTNDGDIVNKILKPDQGHEKEYLVHTVHPVTQGFINGLAKGAVLDGRPTRPAKVTRQNQFAFRIVLTEGRNRQVRRMVEKLGNEVKFLSRERVMHIKLGHLKPGEMRELTKKERVELLKATLLRQERDGHEQHHQNQKPKCAPDFPKQNGL